MNCIAVILVIFPELNKMLVEVDFQKLHFEKEPLHFSLAVHLKRAVIAAFKVFLQ